MIPPNSVAFPVQFLAVVGLEDLLLLLRKLSLLYSPYKKVRCDHWWCCHHHSFEQPIRLIGAFCAKNMQKQKEYHHYSGILKSFIQLVDGSYFFLGTGNYRSIILCNSILVTRFTYSIVHIMIRIERWTSFFENTIHKTIGIDWIQFPETTFTRFIFVSGNFDKTFIQRKVMTYRILQ